MRPKPTQITMFDFDSPAEEQQPKDIAVEVKKKGAVKKEAVVTETTDNSDVLNKTLENNNTPTITEEKTTAKLKNTIAAIPIAHNDDDVVIDFSKTKFAPSLLKTDKIKSTRGRKSIKEMSDSVLLVDVPPDEVLFSKSYYSIGKVAEMFKVNQSLIRLWENQFDILKPKKNGKGDRHFRPEDIKNIQLIHHLTRQKKYTMEGAKEYFKNNKKADEKFAVIEALKKLKGFLYELRANL
jgi:DNA-binding transcriptional MerR regulator